MICTSTEVPFQSSFICKFVIVYVSTHTFRRQTGIIRPDPRPSVNVFMLLHVCDDPGSRGPSGESRSWDCSQDLLFGGRTPGLSKGYECSSDGEMMTGNTFQYQGGSVEEGTLTLPEATGIPVTTTDGRRKTLVAVFHYPNKTMDGMSGSSSLEVTLISGSTGIMTAGVLSLDLAGFIGPQSVGTISGSWKLEQKPIKILRLYTHWHDLAIDVQVGIKKANGGQHILLYQDPHAFRGITNISDSESSLMSPGDRLTLQCTYNNTLSKAIRI